MRHGETSWNAAGRFQGQSDAGLTDLGIAQAHQAGQALRHLNPTALYSSPLPRALKTAEVISQQLSLPVVALDGLMELHLGDLEGITGPDMRRRYRRIYDAWRQDPSQVTFPGGESLFQLQQRAWEATEQMARAHPQAIVAAVSHNFAIGAIVSRLLGLSLSQFHHVRLDLGSISIIELDRDARCLLSLNDRCHLSAIHPAGTEG